MLAFGVRRAWKSRAEDKGHRSQRQQPNSRKSNAKGSASIKREKTHSIQCAQCTVYSNSSRTTQCAKSGKFLSSFFQLTQFSSHLITSLKLTNKEQERKRGSLEMSDFFYESSQNQARSRHKLFGSAEKTKLVKSAAR